MPIKKPILAISGAQTRKDVKFLVVKVTSFDPGTNTDRYYRPPGSIEVAIASTPDASLSIPGYHPYVFSDESSGPGEGYAANFSVSDSGEWSYETFSMGTLAYERGHTITFTEEELLDVGAVQEGAGPLVMNVLNVLEPQVESLEPTVEGQLLLYRPLVNAAGVLLVAVYAKNDGLLYWVDVQSNTTRFDKRTGKGWDPLAGFYSYLVPYQR